MRIFGKVLFALALACCALAAAPAMAHHGRVHFGFYFGPTWYPGPYYYPAPAYYYPPPAVVVQPAPQYIEQPAPAPQSAAPQASNNWYYCRDTQTYYPYVKQCATPWQRVPARPAQ